MKDCIFCKIANRKTDTEIIYENKNFVVFKDINPRAPKHFLIVPKKHTKDIVAADDELWAQIRQTATKLQKFLKLDGFRLVINAGSMIAVPHLHVHFLAGLGKDAEI